MNQNAQEYIDILISLEPVFKRAGDMALQMRDLAKSKQKYSTGNPVWDIVTEADNTVQEIILSEMAKTKLAECKIFAEEDTESVKKFRGENGLVLTLDPIDGTLVYSSTGRFWSTIVSLNDGKDIFYTFLYYPALNFSRRITNERVEDLGEFPRIEIKENLNLDFNKVIYCNDPQDVVSEIYEELTKEGYKFFRRTDVTEEKGSYILLFSGIAAGSYANNPNPYDGTVALHYGRAKNFKVYGNIDISKTYPTSHGPHYSGWYLVLNDKI